MRRAFFTTPTAYESDSELLLRDLAERFSLTPTLRGVVVRHLPKSSDGLESALARHLNTVDRNVRVMYTVDGTPAYSVVNLSAEKEIARALELNKTMFNGAKIFVTQIEKFLAENRPLKGGFDSRRVVVSRIDPFWTEEHLLKMMRPLGDILGVYLPRDYDFPFNLKGIGTPLEKELPERFMTFRELDLDEREATEDGKSRDPNHESQRSSHFLTRAFDYFSNEVATLSQIFQSSSTKDISIHVGELHDLWCFIRTLKEQLYIRPNAEEAEIDDKINSLLRQPEQDKAYEVLLLVRTHGFAFLHSFFQNRGYAYVTFATRRQAERAVICGPTLGSEGLEIDISFHRNEPGYFFNSGKISEAIMEAMKTHASRGGQYEDEKKSSMMARALMPAEATLKRVRSEYEFLGEHSDPVVEGMDSTYSSALETKAKIDSIQAKYYPEKKRSKEENVYMFSSDEEYFSDEEKPGRVDESTLKRTQEDVVEKLFPSDKYAVSSLPTLQSDPVDASFVSRQVSEIQRFFHEAIPSVYRDRPNLLRTQRFADHPQVRYVCSTPFDYSLPPSPKAFCDPAEKRKFIQSQIQHFVLNLQLQKPEVEEKEESFRVDEEKREEELIRKEPEKYLTFTDSDEENAFLEAEKNDPDMAQFDKVDETEPSSENVHSTLKQSAISLSKRTRYTGENLDEYIENLRKSHPKYLFTTEKNEQGEQYVIATLVNQHSFSAKEFLYLVEKYEKQLEKGGTEVEIDVEDQPLFEKFAKVKNFDPEVAVRELLEQIADIAIAKQMEEVYPTIEEMRDLKELTFDEFVKEYRKRRSEKLR